ncbi:MAG: hypothetical protein IH629_06485 [Thermoleophilia bacterium]|nr:hypothetical protein [Thermoleophilia bacterium]
MGSAVGGNAFASFSAAVRSAASFAFSDEVVTSCLDLASRPGDRLFHRAWRESLSVLSVAERATLAPTTGHVAESVAELILEELGFQIVGDQSGPGGHGVDLLILCPDGTRILAVEVKGTLQPRRWPRLRRGALAQMSSGWLDKADNPGMTDWGFTSADVYGAVLLISFAQGGFRLLFTSDFEHLRPVTESADLADLKWLDEPDGGLG